MPLVWRIQNSEGVGPYKSAGSTVWSSELHSYHNGRPSPLDDSLIRGSWENMADQERAQYKFGFLSEEQLKCWFSQIELENLKVMGYDIVILQVSELIKGSAQVIFKYKESYGINYEALFLQL